MPTYEYHCEKCAADFELLILGQERAECPQCGSKKLTQLMSAPAGRVGSGQLPLAGGCPPPDAPPCGPGCCRQ